LCAKSRNMGLFEKFYFLDERNGSSLGNLQETLFSFSFSFISFCSLFL
jgi:hypothetical protein